MHKLFESLESRQLMSASGLDVDQMTSDQPTSEALLLPAVQAAREAPRSSTNSSSTSSAAESSTSKPTHSGTIQLGVLLI